MLKWINSKISMLEKLNMKTLCLDIPVLLEYNRCEAQVIQPVFSKKSQHWTELNKLTKTTLYLLYFKCW